MKSMIAIFILLLTFTSCSNIESTTEGKRLYKFFESQFEEEVSRYPTWQTYLGRKTNYDKLDDESLAYMEKEFEISKQTLAKLLTFDFNSLNHEEKISYKIFKYQAELSIESYKWRFHSFPLNQMFGYQSGTPAFLINMHSIDSISDAKAYISRLKEIHRVFKERMKFLLEQEKRKIFPPHFVFEKVINDSKNIITGIPFDKSQKKSTLFEDFTKKLDKLEIPKTTKDSLKTQAKAALLNQVKPAYRDLISYIQKLKRKVKQNQGAWSLPNGKDYYNYRLKVITTTDLKANEIHSIGLSEVKRIHQEMSIIKKKVGFKGSLKEFFTFMKGDQFLYPQTKEGRDSYLTQANLIISNMKEKLPNLFEIFPKADLIVKPVEAFREKSAGIAFYTGPSVQGNRPGTYYVNLYKMADNPKYKMEALAYHEAIPGHHMQIAIARELEHLPMFRRTGGFTAYSEGWGLYAELLPKEIGFYTDPYSDFGRLSMELWRATRLVVDTAIHAKKWSREKSIKYLEENTPNSKLEIMKGVERYFVMPGQATAYKIGMLKILELREKVKKEMKDKFNIKKFHSIVLKDGGVPLFMLEENINKWIEELSNQKSLH